MVKGYFLLAGLTLFAVVGCDSGPTDPKAQFDLGQKYEYGDGVKEDIPTAFEWYQKSAKQGNAEAMGALGFCYQEGRGTPKDLAEAVKWFKNGAEKGNPSAMLNLGACYSQGKGVPENFVEAEKWFRKSAELGHEHAQYNLGLFYTAGAAGLPRDFSEAYVWFSLSAAGEYKGASQARDEAGRNLDPTAIQLAQARASKLMGEIKARKGKT